jgi:hypothetical protein
MKKLLLACCFVSAFAVGVFMAMPQGAVTMDSFKYQPTGAVTMDS